MSTPRPPHRPVPPPNPGVTENGRRACNHPLIVNGQTAGYCSRLVRIRPSWWLRIPPGIHRGPHRIEWGDGWLEVVNAPRNVSLSRDTFTP